MGDGGERRGGDLPVGSEHDNTNVVFLEVEGHALHTGGELDELTGLDLREAVDAGDTITNGEDSAGRMKKDQSMEGRRGVRPRIRRVRARGCRQRAARWDEDARAARRKGYCAGAHASTRNKM